MSSHGVQRLDLTTVTRRGAGIHNGLCIGLLQLCQHFICSHQLAQTGLECKVD